MDVSTLSQGTLDLIYLAARLGLVRLVTGDRRPPLVFDDPFVTLDDDRAARAVDLLRRLAADRRLPLDRAALDAALADKQAFTGAAGSQIDTVAAAVDELISRYPEAAKYTSGAIL